MSDDEKQLISEQIAKRSFHVGRNPLDTAGMDTDDEEWMDQNPDYVDYVEECYQEMVDNEKGEDESMIPDNLRDEFMKVWIKSKNGPSGTLLKLINDIKEKFNVSYEYTCDGCIRFLKYGIEVHESHAETIQKYVIEAEAKLNTPPISKYYQKQYEKYMKPSVKDDIQDAFFEKVKSEPEKKRSISYGQDSFWRYDHGKETVKTHRYNLRGL